MSNAIDKLNSEFKTAKLSQKGKAVGNAVLTALTDFCKQNHEFAQAVEQSSKKIGDCIEDTIKGSGTSISDIDVYRKAVKFYFAGATIKFNMTIDLGDNGFSNAAEPAPVTLSLDNLLDF